MSELIGDPGKYATVKTSDGATWWVNDYPFATDWLRDKGWLVVYDLAFGQPHTIRSRPDTQELEGLALAITEVRPIAKSDLETLRNEAIRTFNPRRG